VQEDDAFPDGAPGHTDLRSTIRVGGNTQKHKMSCQGIKKKEGNEGRRGSGPRDMLLNMKSSTRGKNKRYRKKETLVMRRMRRVRESKKRL